MTGRYTLDPAMPVLLRPDGAVQVGWDPRRAVLIQPPPGLTAPALATVLRTMHTGAAVEDLLSAAAPAGHQDLTDLVQALVKAGVARAAPAPSRSRAAAVRVHGRGPLAEALTESLQRSGARVAHTSQSHVVVRAANTDLMVLTDQLVADPRVLRELHEARVAHLPVRIRDGVGLVGPMVLPGATACLNCVDLHRSDHDEAWPAVAAQLRDTVGTADRATVLATAALALGQIEEVIRAIRGQPDRPAPTTLSATLEFDVVAGSITSRHWPRHPRCRC